jgi:ParB family chromosome partitioning protein
MRLIRLDPRSLKQNPDNVRRTKSSSQADALLLATVKAVGIVQPPVVVPETDGGNEYTIHAGHRRVRAAVAAGFEEIDVLVTDAANDNGAMRGLVENMVREQLSPVDLWRAIERLVALDWTEDAIGLALAQPVRQIRKLRLLANVLPAMLDHMAKGDMPDERQLRTIAAASLEEQKEVWKKHKPTKADPQVEWHSVAQGLQKRRMYARDASFGDDLAQAYGVEWVEDLFAPANEDSGYTTKVEGYLGAQHEWMTNNLPKRGVVVETTSWGEVKLPPKAERVYGKPNKSDSTAMYLDREGRVQTVHFRRPQEKAKKPQAGGKAGTTKTDIGTDDAVVTSTSRPEVTRTGVEMIGDFRTDALHEAFGRAPIEDDVLMALLVLAFAGQNVSVDSGCGTPTFGRNRFAPHVASLVDADGKLACDMGTLRIAARSVLVDVFSCRENRSNSGVVALIAGEAIGADNFLPNMGTDEFLSTLSRPALEGACASANVLPRQKVRDTRAALVAHFKEGRFVHSRALFAPDAETISAWMKASTPAKPDDVDDISEDETPSVIDDAGDESEPDTAEADELREAA